MSKFRKFFIKHFGYDRRNALRYDLLQPVVLKTGENLEIPAFGLELSETGILLQVDSCVEQGTRVSLTVEIPAPDNSKQSFLLKARGRVVRVCKLLNSKYETVVEFDSVELDGAEAKAKAAK